MKIFGFVKVKYAIFGLLDDLDAVANVFRRSIR